MLTSTRPGPRAPGPTSARLEAKIDAKMRQMGRTTTSEVEDSPRGTILVADHARTNRLQLQQFLEAENYRVVVACNAQEALDAFRAERPDLVIMDEAMPTRDNAGLDGYEAARQIKSELGEDFTPILFLTASGDEQAPARCIECGGDDFLVKPYRGPILKAKLEALARISALYQCAQRQRAELTRYRASHERDLQVAERVFANVAHSAALQGRQLRHLHRAAETVNGDLLLAAPTVAGGLRVLVGDFTGHGLSAAIGALPVCSVFYEMTRKGFPLVDVIREINQKLRVILPTGRFLAGCLLELDASSAGLTLWNGGMPDVLLYDSHARRISKKFASNHLPLGTVDDSHLTLDTEVLKVSNGDRLFLVSDGFVDAENVERQRFGRERLEREIHDATDAAQIFDAVVDSLETFVADRPLRDDVTFLEVVCEPAAFPIDGNRDLFGHRSPSHWSFELDFDANTLRSGHPIPMLAPMLLEYERLGAHWRNISTILTELFANALEHGVLEMNSALKKTPQGFAEYYRERDARLACLVQGWIRLRIRNLTNAVGKGRLEITMEDSGAGFDTTTRRSKLDGNDALSGRGIALVEVLCVDVQYNERGNRVHVVYEWD